ncbi:MAG TPA: WecB/TagA/CpsF family glycosyltransferase [Vicinamibacterales bacterium]|nr:WecB/TagA/CpsF family glycosyltransferase [Vicinamibacterales bacterium]
MRIDDVPALRLEPPPPDFERDVHCLLGLPIDAVDLAGAEKRIRAAAAARLPCFMSTPNVNFLIASRSDQAFRNAVIHSDLSVADGMPLVWLAKLIGIPLSERVAGSNLFDALRLGGGAPLSVYFFGGPDGVAEAAGRSLGLAGPGLNCVGYESPGFGSVEELSSEETIRRINASNADLLVVALGARKGQAWIERNRSRLNVPVISHLGAVLHFTAGTVARAPAWMQSAGLEWLWRIKEEPALWRRYFHDALALAKLLVMRVLPYVLYQRTHEGDRPAETRLEAREEDEVYAITLQGSWTRANIGVLRWCFSQAVQAGKDVRLDMTAASHIDSAFVGLVMLLQGYQQQHRRRLAIASVPRSVQRVMEYCCAEFLCHT